MSAAASRLPESMRAVVYRGVNDLRVETLPVPAIGRRELLVRVAVCGVCPTDIKKIQHGTVPPPRVFGHETSGTIVAVGAGLRGFKVGERVGLHHHIPCGRCHYCRHRTFAQCEHYKRTGITAGFEPAGGGYAEFVRVMEGVLPGVVKIPRKAGFLEGAMLEPVNTVLKGVERLGLQRGDTVWVAGLGPIGLLFTRILALKGMKVIGTDLLGRRRRLGRRFGAMACYDAMEEGLEARLAGCSGGRGVDAVVVAVPVGGVVQQALGWVRKGGRVLLFAHTARGSGLEVDLAGICVDERDLVGSYSADVTLQAESARIVFGGKLELSRLITDIMPLESAAEAIRKAAEPDERSLKIVVSPLGASARRGLRDRLG